MNNPICESLGIRYPILLGGMAMVGTAPLAAAVSEAGGLGILGAATWKPDEFRAQINRVREFTDKPFGANIPVSSPLSGDQVDVVIEEGLPVVTTSAGSAARYTARLKEQGIYVMHVVPMVSFAMQAQNAGVDAIIAEGSESGGYTSLEEISTFVLVPQVVDAVQCPVLAAGGIGDGRGFAAALSLGAVGVQVGTRFLATIEADIPEEYKQALIIAKDTDTNLMRSKKSAIRLMRNDMFQRVSEAKKDTTAEELADWHEHLKSKKTPTRWAAGQVAGLISEVTPVRDIIEGMVRDAENIFRNHSPQR